MTCHELQDAYELYALGVLEARRRPRSMRTVERTFF